MLRFRYWSSMEEAISTYLLISPSKIFTKFSICAAWLALSLITLINYCSKFFKMVLLSQFWNGIKTGNHWTLKNLFNNQFNNILEGRCPFFQWEFLSFHPLGDFVTVFIQFYFAVFFKWKEISTYVFVRMKVYMYVGMCLCCYVCTVKSHNPLYGYFND